MLEVVALNKQIDGVSILRDVSLTAAPGTITGIVGRNGTGKSSLLRTIMGIWQPDGGEVRYRGRNIHRDPGVRRHLIFIPDSRELLPGYTPEGFAQLFALIYPNFDVTAFRGWLERFQLPAGKQLRNFSKGMKALFYLALSFATRAEVLLLDEPTEGLDPIYKQHCLRLILEEVAERQTTVLISSHRLEELQSVCDQVVFLKGGAVDAILELATVQERFLKLQVAFADERGDEVLAALPGARLLSRSGRVFTLLVETPRADVMERLRLAGAVLVEPLPVQLEDLFVGRLGDAQAVR